MTAQKHVLVAGEVNVDLVLRGYHSLPAPGREIVVDDFVMTLGSASAICAVGLARLGTPVRFVGVVGADAFGDYCLGVMRGAGIDLAPVRREAGVKTGVTVSITSAEDRALVTYLGSITALSPDALVDGVLDGVAHLHVSSYFLQAGLRQGCRDLFRRATRRGLTTSLDPGCDPTGLWGPDLLETLRETDVFLPNEVELAGVTGLENPEDALAAVDNGRTLTVVKLGERGAMLRDHGVTRRCAAFRVPTLDATGAGDSFNAGFLHAWLAGEPPDRALALGSACGALSTLGLGGTGSQPTLDEARAFLHGRARA